MSDLPDKLREYRVKIIPAEDAPPPAKYPDNLGYRTKFGGAPDLIQPMDDEDRRCKKCFQPLHFIGQIDSFENGLPHPHFMFGDVGMIYVWFCFNCYAPSATMDCY
jgi:hypothetical protein